MSSSPPAEHSAPSPNTALEALLVSTLLSAKAQNQYRQGAISHDELALYADLIRGLSNRYVNHSKPSSLSDLQAAAYALYYLPINFVKLCFLLHRTCLAAQKPPPKDQAPAIKVLDFGCGPGTGSLAALATFSAKLDITLVDAEASMRSLASKLVQNYSTKLPGSSLGHLTSVSNLNGEGPFDLIIAANVFNEIPDSQALPIATDLTSRLSANGVLLLLEPALPGPTRALMHLRDFLLETSPDLNPIFPCTHRNMCPMLKASPDDWCHGTLEGAGGSTEGMSLVSQFDEILGFNKHRIKYSACIFSRLQVPPDGYRAITDAEKTRKGIEITLCGKDFYGPSILPKSAFSDTNRELRRARSYDLLQITPNAAHSLRGETIVTIVE